MCPYQANDFWRKQVVHFFHFTSLAIRQVLKKFSDLDRRSNSQAVIQMLNIKELVHGLHIAFHRTQRFYVVQVAKDTLGGLSFLSLRDSLVNKTKRLLGHYRVVTFVDRLWNVI